MPKPRKRGSTRVSTRGQRPAATKAPTNATPQFPPTTPDMGSFVRSRGFVRRLYRLRSERLLAALLPFIQLLFFFCFLGPVALCALEAVICSECHAPFAAVSDDTLRSEQHVRAYATSHVLRVAAG